MGVEFTANSLLLCAAGGGFNADAHLQSVYSRRWKNTAVYGASQVQTTICSIFLAITCVILPNIGLLLWKARIWQSGCGVPRRKAPKMVQTLHRFERFVAWNSRSKASPGKERLQGAIQVHFEIPPVHLWVNRVKIPGFPVGWKPRRA